MRKIVLYTLMSLDGDVDDPAGYFTSSPEPGQPPVFDRVMVDTKRGHRHAGRSAVGPAHVRRMVAVLADRR